MGRWLPTPTTRFNLLSLVTLAALGFTLGAILERQLRERALTQAGRNAQVLGEAVVRAEVDAEELRSGLRDETMSALERHLDHGSLRSAGVLSVKLFDGRRRLVFDTNDGPLMRPAPASSNVARALEGRLVTLLAKGTADDGRGAQTLEVYVPLRYADSTRPLGVFELYTDYSAVAAAVRRDTLTMWAVVLGGLALIWIVLFPLVRQTTRTLDRQQARLRDQSRHDALTGLPNRVALHEALAEAVAAGGAALLLVDLDRFREINDTLGHEHGDELLLRAAQRLESMVRRTDVVARLGGDEFAVLRRGTVTEGEARALGALLTRSLRQPLDIRGTTVAVDASIGFALCPAHADEPMTMLRRAEVAMYEAKRRRSGVEGYEPDRDPHRRARLELVGELGRALRDRELVVAYQPKVALPGGAPTGVEALVRWQHPTRGLLGPGEFVPAAELTSLIRPLTLYVLDEALCAQRTWAAAGIQVAIAVNLAGPSVMDAGLPAAVAALLDEHDTDPSSVTLEISEGTIMSDAAAALDVLDALCAIGVKLSLDDFGTGHTSIGQLRRLPLSEVKIDRSFVGDPQLVRTVAELARSFGLSVVAEGVETDDIATSCADAGCDEAQGYLYAKPMWADVLGAWLADQDREGRLTRVPAASTMGLDVTAGFSGRAASAR